jgi:hypothetical protein
MTRFENWRASPEAPNEVATIAQPGFLGRVLINQQPNADFGCAAQCPLLGVKRTWRGLVSSRL